MQHQDNPFRGILAGFIVSLPFWIPFFAGILWVTR